MHIMELILKVYDGLDVMESILDSSKSQVYLDSSKIVQLSLFDSSGNEILKVVNTEK